MGMTRRDLMTKVGTGGAAVLAAALAGPLLARERPPKAPDKAVVPAAGGTHAPRPLPFDPARLAGLSEKMIVSHHDNNYVGAVKNLNRLEAELAKADADTPPFVIGGLKQSQLTFMNSIVLHEAYFGNLGGNGKAGGAIHKAISDTWGSFERWEAHFRAVGASLGGGSGWTVLAWDFHDDGLTTFWSGNHTQTLASGLPLLVMDMYEHAYQMDYGAAAAKYIDAFFQNILWDEVEHRLERARKAGEAGKA